MDFQEIAEKIVSDITPQKTLRRAHIAQIIDEAPQAISRNINTEKELLPPSVDKKRTKFPRHAVSAWLAKQLEANQ